MSEFNLVPQEFFLREKKRTAIWIAGAVISVVLALVMLSFVFVEAFVAAQEGEVAELREQKALSMAERDRLAFLQRRKETLQADKLLLSSLRAGSTMPELVQAIEAARPDEEVRFESWHFRRAGIRTDAESEARPPSYYFVAAQPNQFPKVWDSLTHMTINGEAKDHAALSRFVQRLFGQPNIDDVRIQRSSQSASGVAFILAVVVRSKEGQV